MKFADRTPLNRPDLTFDQGNTSNAATFRSEGGMWELALNFTVFGSITLNVSHRDCRGEYLTAWCLGTDYWTVQMVYSIVRKWMERLPEDFDPVTFRRLAPEHTTSDGRWLRPIATDPQLVRKLVALAGLDDLAGDVIVAMLQGRADLEGYRANP